MTVNFHLRIEVGPDGAIASLFDMDDAGDSMPIAEATGRTADAAVNDLIDHITFDEI